MIKGKIGTVDWELIDNVLTFGGGTFEDEFDWLDFLYEDKMYLNVKKVIFLDKIVCGSSLNAIFAGYRNLEKIIGLKNLDTNNVTKMKHMFCNCASLTNLDLGNFDTSNVTDMIGIFDGCNKLKKIKGLSYSVYFKNSIGKAVTDGFREGVIRGPKDTATVNVLKEKGKNYDRNDNLRRHMQILRGNSSNFSSR